VIIVPVKVWVFWEKDLQGEKEMIAWELGEGEREEAVNLDCWEEE
jgi:hypothetical protein